jgi:hypothetical protein
MLLGRAARDGAVLDRPVFGPTRPTGEVVTVEQLFETSFGDEYVGRAASNQRVDDLFGIGG